MRINILNYEGLLTDEDRKKPLEHTCDNFTFVSCLDLSQPIKVIPLGNSTEFTVDDYSRDVASFISWWSYFVKRDLNGFSGFYHTQFKLIGFTLI